MEVIRENTVIGCATTRFATQVSPEPADRFLSSASRPLSKRQRKDALHFARKAGLNLVWAKTTTKPKARPNAQRPAAQVYFYHPDHLGTATLLTDIYGKPYQLFLNLPFGEEMAAQHAGGDYATRYKFNGKELDPQTGYYYYGARYYDPVISRWLSVDPLAEKYPGLSPYNYTANNPVMLVDPDGKTGETHYFNKKTGEHIYVDDGFDQNIVLVDDKDWSAVKAAQKTKTFLGFSEFYRKGLVKLKYPKLVNSHYLANSTNEEFIYIPHNQIDSRINRLAKSMLAKMTPQELKNVAEALGMISTVFNIDIIPTRLNPVGIVITADFSRIEHHDDELNANALKLFKFSSSYLQQHNQDGLFLKINHTNWQGTNFSQGGRSSAYDFYDSNGTNLLHIYDSDVSF